MPDAPTPRRTRLAAAAGLLGASAVAALLLGLGPAPSALQLAGASSDDVADDISGNCDEAEHAADPECAGTPTVDDNSTSSTVDDNSTTSTTAGGGNGNVAPDDVRSLDAAGAGTVVYAIEGGNLRLVTATPAGGWAVEVEQGSGREIELDFRSGSQRVQVNVELEDGQVRERVRFRDDADDTDIRTEDGVVRDDNSGSGHGGDDDNSGSGSDDSGHDDDDDHSGSGHGGDDDSSGSGRDHPEDD
jgi:hypothetical protein